MQPHVCLLLLVFTTDETWSLCGGDIRLDQNRPAGHVSLVIPGIPSHVTRPAPPRTCLWVLGLPRGRAVRLLPGSGVSVTAGCPGDAVLERSGTILLSGCDRARLTWTGPAGSAEVVQLHYSVLNSDQNRSSPPPPVPQDSWVSNSASEGVRVGLREDSVAPPTVDSVTDRLGSVSQTQPLPLTTSGLTVSPELGTPARVRSAAPHSEGASTSPGPSSPPPPRFFIVPDQPATIRVKTVELLLQMVVEDPRAAAPAGLREAASAWVAPYLRRAAGFTRVLDVWSSGRAVQSLLEFRTSGALQWMGSSASLLHTTGLDLALRDGTLFRKSRLSNITVGGLHADVCHWLLQCPAGFNCRSRSGNFSCSSVCHSDHCQHQGLCTHHTQHLPVCRCLVGDDFWFMGRRCEVRMTRARLVGTCLAAVLLAAAVIGALALAAVRRYRAALIRAKVEQTRSSYHRFDRFDELSARFWARGSAGSLDDGDELLHLRALERPCCYHDDTLSLPSTCPSHLNTAYSAQLWRRGGEASEALDSGKVSDLSVCSWTLEPIHWTPFPLLQQLARRSLESRESGPGSCCEALEPLEPGSSAGTFVQQK
ncbi:uncharacterized protein ACB058_013613 [Synchiropus picturatus]